MWVTIEIFKGPTIANRRDPISYGKRPRLFPRIKNPDWMGMRHHSFVSEEGSDLPAWLTVDATLPSYTACCHRRAITIKRCQFVSDFNINGSFPRTI